MVIFTFLQWLGPEPAGSLWNAYPLRYFSYCDDVTLTKSFLGVQWQTLVRSYPIPPGNSRSKPYPSDPGLEGAVSDELEEVDITEEVTEVMDSLRSVDDMM